MAKSKPRKKKGNTPCKSKKDIYTKIAKRLNELCLMVDCNIMQHINTMEHFKLMDKRKLRIGNVIEVKSPFATYNYKAIYSRRIKSLSKIDIIDIDGLDQRVSLNDIMILWQLYAFLKFSSYMDKALADKALEQIKVFLPEKDSGFTHLVSILRRLCLLENLPNKQMISFDIDADFNPNSKCLCTFNFILIIKKPETEHIQINGLNRPVFKWYFPLERQNENHYMTMPSEQLKHLYKGPKKEFDIYFQSHAIKRLQERLAPINECTINNSFNCFMLRLPQVFIKGHKLFLPFSLNKIKVGYFIAELIQDKFIIKTFILITHASAPEGSKFQTLTGFEKEDMSYWNISKLDTFIFNTMSTDNPLYTYFEQSELLHLFDFTEELVYGDNVHKPSAHWDDMIKCLDKYYKKDTLSNEELKEVKFEHMLSG